MRFLIVEDNRAMCTAIANMIEQLPGPEPIEIDETYCATMAIELIHGNTYDLILLDITLGDRNGLSVLAQIKSFRPRQAVLIVSMHLEEVFAPICLRMGAAGYLEKRYAMGELPVAINTIMSGGTYTSPRISAQSEALYYGHAS